MRERVVLPQPAKAEQQIEIIRCKLNELSEPGAEFLVAGFPEVGRCKQLPTLENVEKDAQAIRHAATRIAVTIRIASGQARDVPTRKAMLEVGHRVVHCARQPPPPLKRAPGIRKSRPGFSALRNSAAPVSSRFT